MALHSFGHNLVALWFKTEIGLQSISSFYDLNGDFSSFI